MPVTDQWADLSTVEMIKKAAELCYGVIPVKEDLVEPHESLDMFTASKHFESPWMFMWDADRALRLVELLPRSHGKLQSLLDEAVAIRHEGDAEISFSMTWEFPDYSDFELVVPHGDGPVGYFTGHDPVNIVATHNRVNIETTIHWGNQ